MKKIKLLGLILGSTMILTACGGGNKEASTSTSASGDQAQTEEVKKEKKWQSQEKKDEMTDKVSKVMTLECDEPASDNNTLSAIAIEDSKNVALIFDKGFVLRPLILDTHKISDSGKSLIKVRFDNGEPQEFKLDTNNSQGDKVFSMLNPQKFIDACKTAKEIKIQYATNSKGDIVFKYTTSEPLPQQ